MIDWLLPWEEFKRLICQAVLVLDLLVEICKVDWLLLGLGRIFNFEGTANANRGLWLLANVWCF